MSDGNDRAEDKADELGLVVVTPGPRQLTTNEREERTWRLASLRVAR